MSRSDPFDFDDEEDADRPRRGRDRGDEDDRRRRRRGDDVEDDYDDRPRRRRGGEAGQGLAIASMIVGIVSVILSLFGWCCFWPVGSVLTALVGIVAVVLGFVGRSQGSRSGIGLAGIITGFAAILISVLMAILILLGIAWVQANPGKFGPAGPGGPKAPAGGPPIQRQAF